MRRVHRPRRRFEPVYSLAVGAGRIFFGGILRLKPTVSGVEAIPVSGAVREAERQRRKSAESR